MVFGDGGNGCRLKVFAHSLQHLHTCSNIMASPESGAGQTTCGSPAYQQRRYDSSVTRPNITASPTSQQLASIMPSPEFELGQSTCASPPYQKRRYVIPGTPPNITTTPESQQAGSIMASLEPQPEHSPCASPPNQQRRYVVAELHFLP